MARPRPPYLNAKATKLDEGHDDTLDAEPPVDPEERSVPASSWPRASAARGGTEPPDGPVAPPPVDPALRGLEPFRWPSGPGPVTPNRPLAEVGSPSFDLDPDVAFWPITILQRWPFTGPPTAGVWPKGWVGVDNTATMFICTVAGEPGTWVALGTGLPGPPGPTGPAGPSSPAWLNLPAPLTAPANPATQQALDSVGRLWVANFANGGQWQPASQLGARIYRAAAWTMTTGLVPYDTAARDPWGMYGGAFSSNGLVVPVDGVYKCLTQTVFPTADGYEWQIGFQTLPNGGGSFVNIGGQQVVSTSLSGNGSLNLTDDIFLHAGDIISGHIGIVGAAGINAFVGTGNTFFTIQWLRTS